ncbi:MAG: hypothetical protein G01um101433_520 [Parcubacteria group bacterium Gr01-1014_33]|nr:MAG: hypothetical protein G01um101433_520 [Parcubacteria group bacterium Gr01-1014_33]
MSPLYLFSQIAAPFIVGLLQIGLAIAIWRKKGRQDASNILFALTVLSISFWCFAVALFNYAPLFGYIEIFSTLSYIAASFIPYFFLLFTFNFPSEKLRISRKELLLLTIPFVITLLLSFFPYKIVREVRQFSPENSIVIPGSGQVTYSLFLIGYFLYAFFNLFRKYHTTKGVLKTQVVHIALATLVPTFIGITTDFFFVIFIAVQYNWIGPVSTIFLFLLILYSMRKWRLFNLLIIQHGNRFLALVPSKEAKSLGFCVGYKRDLLGYALR